MSLLLTLNISHWTVDFYIWPVSLMQTLYKFHAFFVMFVVIFILVLAAGDVTFATENTS